MLNSFSTHCSSCGYEIRDAHSSNAIRELVQKLEQIDTECMAPIERLKDAFGVVVTGVDISSIESDKSSNG